ncbi:MAG TPA: polysaccharide biosynthesis tyrosine autokinase [Longimicrobiaceae bacterium]|nr:polysaccharide biosynthesis tyrosine autokinase [Longimicrobiaceae bacterium]
MSDSPYPNPLLPERVERAERVPVLRSSLTPGGGYEHRAAEGLPLREYVAALRRYWWLIAAAVAVSVGIAAWKVSRERPLYMAGASVRLIDPSVQMSGDLSAGAQGDQLPGWYTDPILSQIQLLRSRNVAGMVADTLGLRLQPARPDFSYAVLTGVQVSPSLPAGDTVRVTFTREGVVARARGTVARAPYGQPVELPGLRFTLTRRPPDGPGTVVFHVIDRDLAINQVLNGLQPRPRELTNVMDIVYTAYDPTLAKLVADAAAESFQRANAESAQQESRRRRLFIQEQLRSTDSLLVIAQRELSSFRKGVQAFSPQEKFRNTQEDLAEFRLRREALSQEKQIYDRMGQELAVNRRENTEQIAALAASPEVSNNGGIIRLYDQLLRYQTLRDSMATGQWSRAPTNPDVQRVDSLIATARSRLVQAVQGRSVALAAQVGVLDQLMAADAASIRSLPDAEAEEMRLRRQVETLQTLVDDLLRERQKARIDEAVEAGQVEIVDRAMVPGGPINRGTRRRILFALFVGLMIGGGGALVLDRMNTALQKREDVENLLHLPALAIIPRIGEAGGARRRLKVPGRALARRAPDPGEALITVTDLHSAGSQAYRKLRTHLIFSNGNGRLRTLLVTSPAASEGKSTICSNLAVTFAQQHLRVVLVDGDLRRSRLHAIFGAPRVPGLVEVLTRESTLDEALRPTSVDGLHVLPAGKLVPNASELLGSGDMHRLLEALAARYDLVIVDTPPVLAAADAEILGVQTDAVLMVVRAGQTERQAAQYAVQQLRAIGAHVVGAVLNDPDHKVGGYGRYAYYQEYYTGEPAA